MIALIQRVQRASVTIENNKISEIGNGFLVLLGVGEDDSEKQAEILAKKTANLRIFTDENDKMNLSPIQLVADKKDCKILVVSQFTLYAMCKGQNRPSFISAAAPDTANELYEKYMELLKGYGLEVEKGEFGADMKVELVNDGPVTIIMDTDIWKK